MILAKTERSGKTLALGVPPLGVPLLGVPLLGVPLLGVPRLRGGSATDKINNQRKAA